MGIGDMSATAAGMARLDACINSDLEKLIQREKERVMVQILIQMKEKNRNKAKKA